MNFWNTYHRIPQQSKELELIKLYNQALRAIPGSPRQLKIKAEIDKLLSTK